MTCRKMGCKGRPSRPWGRPLLAFRWVLHPAMQSEMNLLRASPKGVPEWPLEGTGHVSTALMDAAALGLRSGPWGWVPTTFCQHEVYVPSGPRWHQPEPTLNWLCASTRLCAPHPSITPFTLPCGFPVHHEADPFRRCSPRGMGGWSHGDRNREDTAQDTENT